MADSWIAQLKDCLGADNVKKERLRRKLIDACKQSCIAQKDNLSITPFSDANPLPSFENIITNEFGTPTPDCSPDLISSPYPWGKVPRMENDYIEETNKDICGRISQLYEEAHNCKDDNFNGFDPNDKLGNLDDMYSYLSKYYKPYFTLSYNEWKSLVISCVNGAKMDEILASAIPDPLTCVGYEIPMPINLPLFMDADAKPCLWFDDVLKLVEEFEVKYPTVTKAHKNYEMLFVNFMNHKTGFSHNYDVYASFIKKCHEDKEYSNVTQLCELPAQQEGDIEDYLDCMQGKFDEAYDKALNEYTEYIEEQKQIFRDNYTAHCLSISPVLNREYTLNEYHYTLYYYDQSGNLVKTIPPQGVKFLTTSQIKDVQNDRTAGVTNGTIPEHALATLYKYNSFNQVYEQETPDAGISKFWYDKLGRLVVSQNAEQLSPASKSNTIKNRYSYTQYDPLGRIIEVGERVGSNLPNTDANIKALALGQPVTYNGVTYNSLKDWIEYTATAGNTCNQVTKTTYDYSNPATPTTVSAEQNNFTSRKRVVSTMLYNNYSYAVGATNVYNAATHYSYDINGNAKTVWQENKALIAADPTNQGLKRLDYNFDLISGKVNKVYYQKGKFDQFIHKYLYDAENRLTQVYTSQNDFTWQNDAAYKYYLHGPLARTEIGNLKVQGIDYAYTLQGWLKYINAPSLNPQADMGLDGYMTATNYNSNNAKDVLAYTLHYFNGDYTAIEGLCSPLNFNAATVASTTTNTGLNLYNGNIRATTNQIEKLGSLTTYTYGYDQLNRLIKMRQHNTTYKLPTATNGNCNSVAEALYSAATDNYAEDVSYDANGNITDYTRNGTTAGGRPLAMDKLSYKYDIKAGVLQSNKLQWVHDDVSPTNYPNQIGNEPIDPADIDNQNAGNYTYDNIGNLISDDAEKISAITWTVYGKIESITKTTGVTINYAYDANGNRISKTVTTPATGGTPQKTTTTYYVRDASGNTMAVYAQTINGTTPNPLQIKELHLYGSSRLGVYNMDEPMAALTPITPTTGRLASTYYGSTQYELSNHLGNVLATVSNKIIQIKGNANGATFNINGYIAEVLTAQDYYPFGMTMPGRKYEVNSTYRYGFNGKENDKDISEGAIAFEARIYDGRLGRFFSTDPRQVEYPWQTPYAYFSNCPTSILDFLGAGGEEPPKMNVPSRHKWSAKNFFGKQAGNSIYTNLNGGDLNKMYKEAFDFLKGKGITQGDVALSNGQIWNLNTANGHFNPVSGKGILNLSASEVNQLGNFQSNIKAGKTGEEALANMAKGMEKSGQFGAGSLKGDFLEAVKLISSENGVAENSIIGKTSKFLQEATVEKGMAEAATSNFGKAAKFVKWGGRALVVVAVAADLYEIYNSDNKARTTTKIIGGWAGASAGAAGGAAVGVWAAGWGAIPGGIIGGIGGYFIGSKVTEVVYDWIFTKKK